MNTRTYIASDLHQALAQVRAELGIDAVIVKCETAPDGRVCLHAGDAAMPEDTALASAEADASEEPAATIVPFSSFEARHRERLVERLRSDPTIRRPLPSLPFDRTALLAILDLHRVPDDLCETLVDDAEEADLPDLALALASALDKRMRTNPLDLTAEPSLIMGPFGAGKTSVAARLAAHAQWLGQEVTLAATDLDGAGQLARLEAFAAPLGLKVATAQTREALAEIFETARANQSLLIVDSAGFDPRGVHPHPFAGIEGMEALGVVSASSDAEEARGLADGLIRNGVRKLIVTGLDIARRKGALVAYAASGLEIAQVTASPFFCDGLLPYSPLTLARDLLSPMN